MMMDSQKVRKPAERG